MVELSSEQRDFIDAVKAGYNVLVDACWGSGKTTAIQALADELAAIEGYQVLYLTYNKLLKLEAKRRIVNGATDVTNYHGLVARLAHRSGMWGVAPADLMNVYRRNREALRRALYPVSVLIIDEYQDISAPFVPVIQDVVATMPYVQVVAVGDMDQKIYDRSALDPVAFVRELMGGRPMEEMAFTKSFRLCPDLADALGDIFSKRVEGMNARGRAMAMTQADVFDYLAGRNPSDVICLGKNDGGRVLLQNSLERRLPEVWNKRILYSSIRDRDSDFVVPDDAAVFTTYDSAKGMERPVSVVYDFESRYWNTRLSFNNSSHWILRNIFGVGASRGKDVTIFVKSSKTSRFFIPETLKRAAADERTFGIFEPMAISDAFSFRFEEDIEDAFDTLAVKRLDDGGAGEIEARRTDGLIDLSPCVGICAQALYFDGYDIDDALRYTLGKRRIPWSESYADMDLERKILFLCSLETGQERYRTQVTGPLLDDGAKADLRSRLVEHLPRDVEVEVASTLKLPLRRDASKRAALQGSIVLGGRADAVHDGKVWELKFTSNLEHAHFLQVATYLVAHPELSEARLWNLRTGELWAVRVPDEDAFKAAVLKAVTKGCFSKRDLKADLSALALAV